MIILVSVILLQICPVIKVSAEKPSLEGRYISVMGDEKTKQKAMDGLNSAQGFIRREIGKRVNLRYTPEFVFEADDSIEHGSHIDKLLKDIK